MKFPAHWWLSSHCTLCTHSLCCNCIGKTLITYRIRRAQTKVQNNEQLYHLLVDHCSVARKWYLSASRWGSNCLSLPLHCLARQVPAEARREPCSLLGWNLEEAGGDSEGWAGGSPLQVTLFIVNLFSKLLSYVSCSVIGNLKFRFFRSWTDRCSN